jgi:hypothetical protein
MDCQYVNCLNYTELLNGKPVHYEISSEVVEHACTQAISQLVIRVLFLNSLKNVLFKNDWSLRENPLV